MYDTKRIPYIKDLQEIKYPRAKKENANNQIIRK